MEKQIQKQLEIIERSCAWVNSSLEAEKQRNAYRQLVNFRRKLNKKKSAIEGNHAAAMYGESQVGKSYLISSLLSEKGKPFSITDENQNIHNFIEEINPPGGGNESTGLVSRFSVSYKPKNPKFPIKAILLSPADIALVLCDSYYNDIKADHSFILQTDEINREIESIKTNFQTNQRQQTVFSEDDVLDMEDYFKEHFSIKASNILFSNFFEEVSLLISKAKPKEWKDIFSLLWNKNERFSALFATLITEYEKLNFTKTAYLPIDSVLWKHGTLIDVNRLKEIYSAPNRIEPEFKADTQVMVAQDDGQEYTIVFSKSFLCVLSAELVFSQQETLISSKPFLKESDLLDFPGARGRLTLPVNEINDENIPELLIRGKVAYLFNKYSDAEKISIFVLCAKHEQAAQRSMPEMITNWINKFIGNSPAKREEFIEKSKIPPLFIVGTFFNVNLEYNPLQDKINNLASLDYRWNQRFERTLSVELLNTETYKWFNNWTNSVPDFQNIFLLRDFVYSESKSHIYKGFTEHNRELEEIIPASYPDFRNKLRKSFIEYDWVKRHFADPAESWDRAANINEDGTQLIIDKLSIAATNIDEARRVKIQSELNDLAQSLLLELQKYHHSADKDEELQKAKSVAGDIQLKLDLAFKGDGINLFGPMMNDLMIDEGSVYKLYRQKLDEIERRDVINLDKYSTIRINVTELNAKDPYEVNLDRLYQHYEMKTDDQKEQFKIKLESEGIDLEELFYGNNDRIKNYSQQLSEALIEFWLLHVAKKDKYLLRQILSESALQEILDMFQKLFKKLNINKIIAEKIRTYVDGFNKVENAYEMMADISAEILNKCINTVGIDLFSKSDLQDLEEANNKNDLGLTLSVNQKNNLPQSKEEIGILFSTIDNLQTLVRENSESIKILPNYSNYQNWYNRLKVGFVSVCDIPNYDIQANERLGAIINEAETIKY